MTRNLRHGKSLAVWAEVHHSRFSSESSSAFTSYLVTTSSPDGRGITDCRAVAYIPRWDPDAGGPAYVYMRVADHLAARIAAGDLAADARLPGERDLAAEYGITLGTARRAVEELRDRGLAITLPGKGTFRGPLG